MTTFKIYYGAAEPMVAVGKHQSALLRFSVENRGLHSYAKDQRRVVARLTEKGYLRHYAETGQFEFTYPKV